MNGVTRGQRIDWVDYAKGICIILVVMMHSTIGLEHAAGAQGWMHNVVEFAKPFRMPDFFLLSGLFVASVIDRDWKTYLDRKVVHFAYFYILWMTIQFAFKAPALGARRRRAGARARLCALADRAVRHAVVHLSAADLLRGGEADPPRSGLDHVAARRRARNLALPRRVDGAGRIRAAFRLFLFRLCAGAAHLQARQARAGQSFERRDHAGAVGAGERSLRPDGIGRRCRSCRSHSASLALPPWCGWAR